MKACAGLDVAFGVQGNLFNIAAIEQLGRSRKRIHGELIDIKTACILHHLANGDVAARIACPFSQIIFDRLVQGFDRSVFEGKSIHQSQKRFVHGGGIVDRRLIVAGPIIFKLNLTFVCDDKSNTCLVVHPIDHVVKGLFPNGAVFRRGDRDRDRVFGTGHTGFGRPPVFVGAECGKVDQRRIEAPKFDRIRDIGSADKNGDDCDQSDN